MSSGRKVKPVKPTVTGGRVLEWEVKDHRGRVVAVKRTMEDADKLADSLYDKTGNLHYISSVKSSKNELL